jgi:nitroreductase
MSAGVLARVLPSGLVRALKGLRHRARMAVLRMAASSPRLASLYYGVFSSRFRREHRAVAYGRLRFLEDAAQPAQSEYLLRRNVHRLEKGLIMRPRRPVFATDFIEETVESFAGRRAVAGAGGGDPREVRWAERVLVSYFEAAGGHPRIERARERFAALHLPSNGNGIGANGNGNGANGNGNGANGNGNGANGNGNGANGSGAASNGSSANRVATDGGVGEAFCAEGPMAPYRRDLSAPPPVAYGDLLKLAFRRRSVRWFLPRPVPRDLIDKAVEVAAYSPSACNRQPFEFRIFDEPERARRVAGVPLGTRGFDHNFPAVVVVVARQRAYFDEKDRHVVYIDGALGAMSFVLALETLGLSSCCINWPDVEKQEREMAELLRLEPDERPVMLIAVGYPDPDALVPASGKKSLDNLRRYDTP